MNVLSIADSGGFAPEGVRFVELDAETAAVWRLPRRAPLLTDDAATATAADPAMIARGIRKLLAVAPAHPDAEALTRFLQKADRDLWQIIDTSQRQGDWRAMIRALELMTAIDPEDARAHADLAYAYRRAGKRDRAEAAYRRAIALAPALAAAQTGLGALLLENDDPASAITWLRHSVQVREDQPSAHYYLGRAYGALGDDALAAEHLARAMTLAPDDPRPAYYLAVARSRLGDRDGALALLDALLATDPTNYDAAALRAALVVAPDAPPD